MRVSMACDHCFACYHSVKLCVLILFMVKSYSNIFYVNKILGLRMRSVT